MNMRLMLERSNELECIVNANPASAPEMAEFQQIALEKGLKAALSWNTARFAEEDAWYKEARERG